MAVAHPPVSHQHRFHINPWILAVIVLSAALVALGVWVLVDREEATTTTPPAPQSLKVSDVRRTLDGSDAAALAGDQQALAAIYSNNAMLEDLNGGYTLSDSYSVADYILAVTEAGARLRYNGEPIVLGDRYAVVPVTV